jgi:magnesium transporter
VRTAPASGPARWRAGTRASTAGARVLGQNALVQGQLVTIDGEHGPADAAKVHDLLQAGTRFWLDLDGAPGDEESAMLRDIFGFHPLAVEDAEHFHQRPKLDTYDGYVFLVVYGVTADAELIEVHCFYTDTYLVTVHHDRCPALAELGQRWHRAATRPDHVMLLYRVLDTLVDGFFPVLFGLDDEIDELEDAILERPTDEQLGQLFDLKRSLVGMRKVVSPQRDFVASMLSGAQLPGMTPDAERYFRDLYDHLIRISDLIDSYRDLLSSVLDTHLSTVSNRLNVVMKQLTIIATVFLPLSFLTGFFGQNFGWMVNHLQSGPVFAIVGVGLQVVVAAGLVVLFKRRGWTAPDETVRATPAAGRGRALVGVGRRRRT